MLASRAKETSDIPTAQLHMAASPLLPCEPYREDGSEEALGIQYPQGALGDLVHYTPPGERVLLVSHFLT